jgi:DNA invertase Pin-like site-specific DNA recombinase
MNKVAAYIRVSTDDQTTDNQLPEIKAWCEANNHELVKVYSEEQSAWKAGHQKELANLLYDLRVRRVKYDIICVWALDRLTRQGIASILGLVNTFKQYGARIISIQDSWTQADSALSDLLYAVCAWVAKYESDRRSERVKAGLARVRLNGTKSGIPIGKRGKDKENRKRTGYINRYLTKDNKNG